MDKFTQSTKKTTSKLKPVFNSSKLSYVQASTNFRAPAMRSIQSGGGGDGGVDVTCYLVSPGGFRSLVGWLSAAVALNVVLGFVSLWSCYANHFLHWGALATWALLLAQGRTTRSTVNINQPGERERGLKTMGILR